MEKAGLIIKRDRDGTYFDRFRDRLCFRFLTQMAIRLLFQEEH